MASKEDWIEMNLEELKKRTVNFDKVSDGNVIVFSGKNNQYINFVSCSTKHGYKTIKANIINCKKLRLAGTLEKRLHIVVDALRDVSIQFYFDNDVMDLILNGN